MVFELEILRAGDPVTTITIDEKTVYSEQFMTEKVITSEVISSAKLPISLNDYIVYDGKQYDINEPWLIREKDELLFYTITFEDEIYKLLRKLIKDEKGRRKFPYYGDAQNYLQLIVDLMNTISSGWSVGQVDLADEQHLEFDGDTCRSALTKIAEAFKLEFSNDGKVLNLVKRVGQDLDVTFEHGMNNGLYELELQSLDDSKILTRLFGYGGSQNIDASYRDNIGELVFEDRYIDRNVELYGIREGDFIDATIFPKRTGSVTATTNLLSFVDSTIDFDLNDCFVEGVTPTISIKSGDLTGVDLDIKSYEHATKTVYLEELDSEGYILPSVLRKLQVGNEYVFLGIKLPDAYKITAEADLYEATDMASQESAIPGVSFGLTIDEKYIRDNNFALKVGDRPLIKSTKLGISNRLRITAIKFPLVNPASITATVGNVIVYQRVDQLTIDSKKNSIAIKQVANQVAATKPQLGAFLSYRGEYDSTVNYYGGKDRVEVVLYDGDFYRSVLTAGTFKGFTPTNPVKWKKFDGQFDSLATGLLLAELAYIENLGVRFLSTDTEGHKRFEINGVDNNAKLIDALDRVLLLMDDDSAFEGVYYTLFPPIPDPTTGENPKDFLYQREIGGEMRYYYATMGAGLSIGLSPTDSGGFTSLGRKEVYSTAQFRSGSPDRSEESTMNKDGFKTTGGLSVGGDTNLDGDVQILGDIFLEPSEKGQSFYMTFANSSLNGGAVGTHTIGFLKGVAYEVT